MEENPRLQGTIPYINAHYHTVNLSLQILPIIFYPPPRRKIKDGYRDEGLGKLG